MIFKRLKFTKAKTHLFLLKDSSLGKKGEIILETQERARNLLIPLQLAYYVPRVRGKPLLPLDFKEKQEISEEKIENIFPFFSDFSNSEIQEILNQSVLPDKITISRKVVPGTRKIFGSVTQEDILQELKLETENITDFPKIKQTGDYTLNISGKQVQVQVTAL